MLRQAEDFLNDIDKMYDFLDDDISKDRFLESYSYLSVDDYNLTKKLFEEDITSNLAYLLRDAENMIIEENTYYDNEDTNPYKCYSVTGEQLKDRVCSFAQTHLTEEEYAEFCDIADGMAC